MRVKALKILWLLPIIFVLYSLVGGCGPKFKPSEEAAADLRKIPGRIEIKLLGSDKSWICSISKGAMACSSVADTPGPYFEARPYIYLRKEVPQHLPKIPDCEYSGPFATSPDNSFAVYSISAATGASFGGTDFVLIRTLDNALVSRGDLSKAFNSFHIDSISISPDSSLIAVLHSSSRLSLGFKGIVGVLFAHPVYSNSMYLSIYNRNGKLLVRTDIAARLLQGRGQVSWTAR
jgi:hypothetical protein